MLEMPVRYLPRRAVFRVLKLEREQCATISKAERRASSEPVDSRHKTTEFGVFLVGFHSCFGPIFPRYFLCRNEK